MTVSVVATAVFFFSNPANCTADNTHAAGMAEGMAPAVATRAGRRSERDAARVTNVD